MHSLLQPTLATALSALVIATSALAIEAPKSVDTFTAKIENDVVGGSDSRYTSGIEFTWGRSQLVPRDGESIRAHNLAQFGHFLLGARSDAIATGSSLSIGQKTFTPKSVWETKRIPGDRPYAGWLYINFGYHERSPSQTRSISLTIGTVGPQSFAKDFQKGFHQLIDSYVPAGWDNQIENEIGVNIVSRIDKSLFRGHLPNDRALEIRRVHELVLGTVNASYRTGFNARLGRQIPSAFSSPRIQNSGHATLSSNDFDYTDLHFEPHKRFYWTAGANVSYIAKNLFIEGGRSSGEYEIEKSDLVGEVELGFTHETKRLRLSFSYVYRTKEFKEQGSGQGFGSLAITLL